MTLLLFVLCLNAIAFWVMCFGILLKFFIKIRVWLFINLFFIVLMLDIIYLIFFVGTGGLK